MGAEAGLHLTVKDRAGIQRKTTVVSRKLPLEGRVKWLGFFHVERSMKGRVAGIYKIVKAVPMAKSG